MFSYSDKDREILVNKIEELYGAISEAYSTNTFDEEKTIDVLFVDSPNEKCKYVITIGLGYQIMSDGSVPELVFPMKEGWDVEERTDESAFILDWINMTYAMTKEGKEMFPGTVNECIGSNDRLVNNFNGIILFPGRQDYKVALDTCYASLLHVEPLYPEEITFKNNHGVMSLFERIAHIRNVEHIDLQRLNSCQGAVKPLKIKPTEQREIISDDIAYKLCLVSDKIMVEGNKVGVCFRDELKGSEDSGWIFLSGLESEEELSDFKYFDIYDIQHLLNYDEEVQFILDSPEGSAFRRDDGGIFVRDEICPEKALVQKAIESIENQTYEEEEFSYDGNIHIYKIGAKGLNAPEINGLTHIAIYVRAMVEMGFLRDDLDEDIRQEFENSLREGFSYPIREYIRDRFDCQLPYDIFDESGKIMTKRYMEEAYTQHVDTYTKARYVKEGKNVEEAQTEEYLFIDFDEDYYDNMKSWLEEKAEYTREVIMPRRAQGKMSDELRQTVDFMLEGLQSGEDIEYVEIYCYIMDEMQKLIDKDIFSGDEIFGDAELISEAGQYILKEDSFRAMELLLVITGHSIEDAEKKGLGKWFYTFGQVFLRRGFISDAYDMFEMGTKVDEAFFMNWYYTAVLALTGKGKAAFERAMNVVSKRKEDIYLVRALIDDLKRGISKPGELLLHMEDEEEDRIFREKLEFRKEELSSKEFRRVKVSESVDIDDQGIESIAFILGEDIRKTESGETVVVIDDGERELVYTFFMSIGVFSKLRLDFIERMNLAVSEETYKSILADDGNMYILERVIVEEDYSVALGYFREDEPATRCLVSLEKNMLLNFGFPDGEEVKNILNNNIKEFTKMYTESSKSISNDNLYS